MEEERKGSVVNNKSKPIKYRDVLFFIKRDKLRLLQPM